jgi:prepilin-type N-terminal cleavage/methylation domain-containing protein
MPSFSRLRRDEGGFSLVELMMAMALGSLVLTAVMTIFIRGIQASTATTNRVEAAQNGRLAMDRVITLLNSQTCVYANNGTSSPPIVDGQDNSVTFYANLGDVAADPVEYRIRYDAPNKQLLEDRWAPAKDAKGAVTYPGPPTTRIMATNILPEAAGTPFFRYYQFVAAGALQGTIDPTPLPTPLTTAGRFAAVRIEGALNARALRSKSTTNRSATIIRGAGTVGSADGSDPLKGVNC